MSELKFEKVSKLFARENTDSITHAISDISFTLKDGEFVSIVGPSGCGKSTMLRLIAGLIPPTYGNISLDSKPITGADSNRGMVFQKSTLFPWLSVKENVEFSNNLNKKTSDNSKEVEKMLEKVDLLDFKDSYPKALSGGMAQRVSLIRTLINKPEVLLLDEPLGALDAFTRMNMQDLILKLWHQEENLCVMVTHDVDEAVYMSSKVIIMEPKPGRIKDILDIDLAYPRVRTSQEFTNYRNKILETLNIN